MKDNYFDQIFARKFAQLPGAPYRNEDWAELAGRLDQYERRRRSWVLPILLPLFGLLAAGNLFWWHQWREAERKNAATASPVLLAPTDTIVRATVVYRYDTIYQQVTLVQRQLLRSAVSTTPEAPAGPSVPAAGYASDAAISKENLSSGLPPIGPDPATPATNPDVAAQLPATNAVAPQHTPQHHTPGTDSVVAQEHLLDSVARATPPGIDPKPNVDVPAEKADEPPPVIKKRRAPELFFARPRLALSLGWSNPLLPHKRSGFLLGAGVGADVEIAKNTRLAAEVSYWQGKIKADETKALEEVHVPNPGSDYKLKYWEIYRLSSISYAVQLRYQVPIRKAWKPWIGLGYQAVSLLPFEIEFDFENQLNKLELQLSGEADELVHAHGLLGSIGLERSFGPRFSLSAEGWLLRRLGGEESSILDQQVGLKTRFYYSF